MMALDILIRRLYEKDNCIINGTYFTFWVWETRNL